MTNKELTDRAQNEWDRAVDKLEEVMAQWAVGINQAAEQATQRMKSNFESRGNVLSTSSAKHRIARKRWGCCVFEDAP